MVKTQKIMRKTKLQRKPVTKRRPVLNSGLHVYKQFKILIVLNETEYRTKC